MKLLSSVLVLLAAGVAAAGPNHRLPNLPSIPADGRAEVATIRARHPRIERARQRHLVKLSRARSPSKQRAEARVMARLDRISARLSHRADRQNTLIILEGDNGAGKSSTIRRMVDSLSRAGVKHRVVHFGAPPAGANDRHWFERYFAKLPRNGEIVIFDRSWYGRAVWEPYHGLITDKTAKRSLKQIKAFEKGLQPQIKIIKFFLGASSRRQAQTIGKREARGGEEAELSDYTGLRDRKQVGALYRRAMHRTDDWHKVSMNDRARGRLKMFDLLDRELFR